MYLVGRYMREFSQSYNETIGTNYYIFTELLSVSNILKVEEVSETTNSFIDGQMVMNSKEPQKVLTNLTDRVKTMRKSHVKVNSSKRDLNKLYKLIKGE